ncbi:MAG: M28 family peptidase, partial [Candidatus Latescibacterota bacterium]
AFDGERAFAHLEEQCAIGPRYPGSAGHVLVREYLVRRLEEFGASVSRQPFEAVLSTGDTLSLENIVGSYRPGEKRRVLLGAHFDTRPRADRDPDEANRALPIPGANDGASGVAVLLEIARLLGGAKPPVGVDIVLFDGEDYGEEGRIEDYLLGSKHYASRLGGRRPAAVIVVDMVGERGARFPIEGYSGASSPGLVARVWGAAEELGVEAFERSRGPTIVDDHLPFIQAGLAAINIIDFDYPHWHTLADTPDKCDPRSLEAVGRVLVRFLWGAR